MRRVLVIGSPGAGKSTLAKALAARASLPLTHLDELYWETGRKHRAPDLWPSRLQAALAGERWILNGNFSSTLLERAYRADTVFFLRPLRRVCLWQAFWRERLGRHPHGRPPPRGPRGRCCWTSGNVHPRPSGNLCTCAPSRASR
ncbi:MAG: DNA topology modulation protein FlaR [Deinococcota bacterium]